MSIRFVIPGPCPGKPRQTQSDKWRQRPCVMAYRRWADEARRCAKGSIPRAETVELLVVLAYYQPPASWSKKKKTKAMGRKKRSKPDGDNALKACCDALWPDDDAALGDLFVQRFFGPRDETVILIDCDEKPTTAR